MIRTTTRAALAALAFLATTWSAVPVSPAVAEPAAGSIGGVVTVPTGTSATSVGVVAYIRDPTYGFWKPVASTAPSEAGPYGFTGLAPNTYRVCTRDPGGVVVDECFSDAVRVESASDLVVGADQTVTQVDLDLPLASHLRGTVTARAGADLSRVVVTATVDDDPRPPLDVRRVALTPSGSYDLSVRAGTYRVCFRDPSGSLLPWCIGAEDVNSARRFQLAEAATLTLPTVRLQPPATISGTVSGPPGTDLSRIGVSVSRYSSQIKNWGSGGFTTASASGDYTVGALRAGTYRICFTDYAQVLPPSCFERAADVYSATDVTVEVGSARVGIDATLDPASHVAGRVTGPGGRPVPDVSVEALRLGQGAWNQVATSRTDGDGRYDVGGLRAGTYRLCFTHWLGNLAARCYAGADDVSTATDVVVGRGRTVTGRNIRLRPAAHITGTLTGPQGRPLDGIDAVVSTQRGGGWDWVASAVTTADGTYDVGRLPAGTYRVCFTEMYPASYRPECWDDVAAVDAATDITVAAAQTSPGHDARLVARRTRS